MSIDEDLECPICLEPYDLQLREPKVLPCSGAHELCEACALKLRSNGTVGGQDITCPACREPLPAGRQINTNRGLVAALKQQAAADKDRARLAAAAAAAQAEAAEAREAARIAREQASSRVLEEDRRPQQQRKHSKHGKHGKQHSKHTRSRARAREGDPVEAEHAELQRQFTMLIVTGLVLTVAVLVGLWMGRRSGVMEWRPLEQTWHPASRPVDADLEPRLLWADAVAALHDNRHEDAAWLMLITIYLDWSYNDGSKLPAIRKALAGCGRCGLWVEPLRPLIASPMGGLDQKQGSGKRFYDTYEKLAAVLNAGPAWHEYETNRALSPAPLGSSDDRLTFATACAATFYARDQDAVFRARSFDGTARALWNGRRVLQYAGLAATHLQPERYLTLMFELAYANRLIHSIADGTKWSKRFQAAAPQPPSSHWKFFLARDQEGEEMARGATKVLQSDMTYEEKAQYVADAAVNSHGGPKYRDLPAGLRRIVEDAARE